nr:MAG: major capsid protein [Microviridae sp.]
MNPWNIFNSVKIPKVKRNNFDLSHTKLLTTDLGLLVPVLCEHVLPNDTWKVRTECLVKMLALKAPIMSQLDVYVHYFYVPFRLIWDDFEEFITGGEDGTSTPVWPTLKFGGGTPRSTYLQAGSLYDYLGFPVQHSDNWAFEVDQTPFRAYQFIYNTYYRDQNLEEEIPFSHGSGVTTNNDDFRNLMNLRYRKWTKDYFTSALPWTQRGAEIRVPFESTAQGILNVTNGGIAASNGTVKDIRVQPASMSGNDFQGNGTLTSPSTSLNDIQLTGVNAALPATLSGLKGPTVNELRRSIAVQKWAELSARAGSRYKEHLLAFFGRNNSDGRLQRPQYLGGGKQPVVISELLQTSQTTETSPQGTQTGNGVSLGSTNQFKYNFPEDGLVMGIMSIIPKAVYTQGMPKKYTKRDRFEFGNPMFAHLGEQEIHTSELYFDPKDQNNNSTFGYTPRYAEYKFINSSVHGDFHTSMDYWHLGRKFGNAPALNNDFISVLPQDADRIFPIETGEVKNPGRFYVQLYSHITAKRPLPRFGTPSI